MITWVLVLTFGLGALLDLFMATLGMAVIFKASGLLIYTICAIISLAFLTLRLCMEKVSEPETAQLYRWLQRTMWCFLLLNVYATANAVIVHVINQQPLRSPTPIEWTELIAATPLAMLIVGVFLVGFMVISPMYLSYLLKGFFNSSSEETEEEMEIPLPRAAAAKGQRN